MISISIIIPVYKVPLDCLRVCFDSLVAQTMQECEFIVVSDGAPEAECSVCEEYAAKDLRFKYFKREHAGVSATRNYGIDQAQGEYISFVDSDDFVKPNYLSILSQLDVSPDIIFFNFTFQFQNKIISKHFPQTTFATDKNSIQDCLLKLFDQGKHDNLGFTWNKFFKKSIIDRNKIRFDDNIFFFEDEIFTLQYSQHISNLYISNAKLYHYNFSKKGLTCAKKNATDYHNIFVKFIEAIETYPNTFKEVITNKRIHFIYFLSIIKQKGMIDYSDFSNFRSRFLQEKKKKYSCLTLRLIFFFPKKIAYILCYIYKMIYWLPGLKSP